LIDFRVAQAQGFPRGGTTFTPSGNGVRWPVTLAPTPGRPLGVSNMTVIPTPGMPPAAFNNLAPGSAISGTSQPLPGSNLGGFGSVPQGAMDIGGPVIYLPQTSVESGPAGPQPYATPNGGTAENSPSGPIIGATVPANEGVAPIPLTNTDAGTVVPNTAPTADYGRIGITVAPGPSSNSPRNLVNSSPEADGLRAEVQDILKRSSRFDSAKTIQVALEGDQLVLRGIVKDDHERRLAEAVARLTPGVVELRNELAVKPQEAP
jgi:hypothetical protein